MNDQLTQQILARIDVLAAKLGTTAVYLWGVLLQQAKIEAYTDFFNAGVCLFFLGIGLILLYKSIKKVREGDYHYDTWCVVLCVSSIVSFFLVICAIENTVHGVQILLNPAYWALQHIF